MNELIRPFVESVSHIPMTGLVILKDGEELARHIWEDEICQNQYSASKSFTSAAVGIAQAEGLLAIEDAVLDYFPADAPENPCPKLTQLKIKHLLTMTLGQSEAHLMGGSRPAMITDNWVKYLLAQSFSHVPGERFLYDNAGPYLAGLIVQRRAGCNLVEYLMPRLFRPLAIPLPIWEVDRNGDTFGAGGLFLTVTHLARFAQLYLQQGRWNGEQLIPADWVAETARPRIVTGHTGVHSSHYGYLFWNGPDGSFRADGKYGQYGIVLPKKNAVIAINAFNRSKDNILDSVWEYLVPVI